MKKSFWLGLIKYAVGLALLAYVVYSNWDRPPGAGLKVALARPVQWLPLFAAGALLGTAGHARSELHGGSRASRPAAGSSLNADR